MRRRRVINLVAVIFASLSALSAQTQSGQSMPTYWRLADPEAKILAGFDLKALLNSPAAADWKAQFQKATGGAIPVQLHALDEGGVLSDLFQRVDRVFISAGEIPQGTTSKPKMTVALVGDFDLAALRKFMVKQGGVKSLFRGVEIWQSGKSAENVMIALASPQVLALGDKASVRKAVTQFAVGGASAMSNPVYKRAAALVLANDIWMAGEVPESSAAEASNASLPMSLAKSVRSFDFGLRTRAGLDLELNLFAGDAETAKSLSTALQAMMQLAASDRKNPQVNDLLKRLQMGTQDEQLHITASWTQAELADLARLQGKSLAAIAPGTMPDSTLTAARVTNGRTAATAELPVVAKPREPLKVRIYNPDGGVKEFELKRD